MPATLTLPAPAKINRFLAITGRRTDGYHTLQTVFQFLDYSDELTFADHNTLTLVTTVPALSTDDNLIIKAAKLLQQATGCQRGAHITLNKKLPIGGGLGGGSSDAATTLVGLNAWWQLGLSSDQLADLGVRLGADVPVFVSGHSAFAEGIGERLTPVALNEPWYLVLVPPVHVNTAAMYKHPDLPRNTPPIAQGAALDQPNKNDFEPLARRLYPAIDQHLALLDNCRHQSIGRAMLSGSGACVFAPFNSQVAAASALAALGAHITGFVARGINQSPLHTALRDRLQ